MLINSINIKWLSCWCCFYKSCHNRMEWTLLNDTSRPYRSTSVFILKLRFKPWYLADNLGKLHSKLHFYMWPCLVQSTGSPADTWNIVCHHDLYFHWFVHLMGIHLLRNQLKQNGNEFIIITYFFLIQKEESGNRNNTELVWKNRLR